MLWRVERQSPSRTRARTASWPRSAISCAILGRSRPATWIAVSGIVNPHVDVQAEDQLADEPGNWSRSTIPRWSWSRLGDDLILVARKRMRPR